MASTYSNLKIQLMATGENSTTWGDVTNVNLGTAIEEAVVGSADVAFSNADVTLTLTNTNSTQTARNLRLNLTGTATTGYNLILGSGCQIEKPYIVNNDTDGTITVKNTTGAGVAVPAGKSVWVYNTGTDVVDVITASAAPVVPPVSYPQNIQAANYTLVLDDAGKQIFHPASDTNVRTYTIPSNASVAFPIGTVVLFTVENGGTVVLVAITSDTLVFGDGTTGNVRVLPNNTLMAIKVTATKWMANYLYQTGSAQAGANAIAVASSGGTPYVTAYPWNTSTGFGTKYANPSTLPTNPARGVAFNPTYNAIAVAADNGIVYPWSSLGFGTKYADPATLPGNTLYSIKFSPAGDAIAMSSNGTPYIQAYPWTINTGFGTKYTNPVTLPTGSGLDTAFSPAGDAIAVAHSTTPFITAYPWSASTGFGTKYANPSTLPTGGGNGVAFSPAGDAVAIVHDVSPFITAYPWSASTGFGTKYTNPVTPLPNTGREVAFSPAGNAIAATHGSSPLVTAYSWSSSGFGTKYTDPATLPYVASYGIAFNPSGDTIAIGCAGTPFVIAYPWNGTTGFGIKYANPGTVPGSTVEGVAFSLS